MTGARRWQVPLRTTQRASRASQPALMRLSQGLGATRTNGRSRTGGEPGQHRAGGEVCSELRSTKFHGPVAKAASRKRVWSPVRIPHRWPRASPMVARSGTPWRRPPCSSAVRLLAVSVLATMRSWPQPGAVVTDDHVLSSTATKARPVEAPFITRSRAARRTPGQCRGIGERRNLKRGTGERVGPVGALDGTP